LTPFYETLIGAYFRALCNLCNLGGERFEPPPRHRARANSRAKFRRRAYEQFGPAASVFFAEHDDLSPKTLGQTDAPYLIGGAGSFASPGSIT
jgi:hypothetical protein